MSDHNGWDTAEERRVAEALARAGLVDHDDYFVEREVVVIQDCRDIVEVVVDLLRQERESAALLAETHLGTVRNLWDVLGRIDQTLNPGRIWPTPVRDLPPQVEALHADHKRAVEESDRLRAWRDELLNSMRDAGMFPGGAS